MWLLPSLEPLLRSKAPVFPTCLSPTRNAHRNLGTPEQVRRFYRLFHDLDSADIVDEPVPRELVLKYSHLGLPEKADAFIGALAEWQQVRYLVSDNRHFLRDLRTDAFEVLQAIDLISRWETGTL